MRNKRGQLTLFIIFGLVILTSIIALFLLYSREGIQEEYLSSSNIKIVKESVEDCMYMNVEKAVLIMGFSNLDKMQEYLDSSLLNCTIGELNKRDNLTKFYFGSPISSIELQDNLIIYTKVIFPIEIVSEQGNATIKDFKSSYVLSSYIKQDLEKKSGNKFVLNSPLTLTSGNNRATLTIQENSEISITNTQDNKFFMDINDASFINSEESPYLIGGVFYDIHPEIDILTGKALLSINYTDINLSGLNEEEFIIVFYDPLVDQFYEVPSKVDKNQKIVSANIESIYSITSRSINAMGSEETITGNSIFQLISANPGEMGGSKGGYSVASTCAANAFKVKDYGGGMSGTRASSVRWPSFMNWDCKLTCDNAKMTGGGVSWADCRADQDNGAYKLTFSSTTKIDISKAVTLSGGSVKATGKFSSREQQQYGNAVTLTGCTAKTFCATGAESTGAGSSASRPANVPVLDYGSWSGVNLCQYSSSCTCKCSAWDYNTNSPCPTGYVNCDDQEGCGHQGTCDSCSCVLALINAGAPLGANSNQCKNTDADNKTCLTGYVNCDGKGDCDHYGNCSSCLTSNNSARGPIVNTNQPTCNNFTYSNWTNCNSLGAKTRTIVSRSPTGCVGGVSESLVSTCATCNSFTYSNWTSCNSLGTRTRTIMSRSPVDCIGGNPENLTGSCLDPCSISDWQYVLSPSTCPPEGKQNFSWEKSADCDETLGINNMPSGVIDCNYNG